MEVGGAILGHRKEGPTHSASELEFVEGAEITPNQPQGVKTHFLRCQDTVSAPITLGNAGLSHYPMVNHAKARRRPEVQNPMYHVEGSQNPVDKSPSILNDLRCFKRIGADPFG